MLNVVLKMASQGATPESFILESVVRRRHIQADMDPFLGREATDRDRGREQ